MKKLIGLCLMVGFFSLQAQEESATLRSILLEQLKTTHDVQDWFVPPSLAVAGLTAEQANWKDDTDNHSIAQLATHLIFWDGRILDQFLGKKGSPYSGDNRETFSPVSEAEWKATVEKLDTILKELEEAVTRADENELEKWYSTLAHIGTHNAYHSGQILYIRKMKGWWDPDKGVK